MLREPHRIRVWVEKDDGKKVIDARQTAGKKWPVLSPVNALNSEAVPAFGTRRRRFGSAFSTFRRTQMLQTRYAVEGLLYRITRLTHSI